MNLTGKVALVTGASRGIGQAAAIELAKAGADIIVNFIGNEAVAQETVEAIEALGRKAIKIKADVGNASIFSTVSCATASLPIKFTTTSAPAFANSIAVACPIPREAPVTKATLPVKFILFSL